MSESDLSAPLRQNMAAIIRAVEKIRTVYMIVLVAAVGTVSFMVTFILLYINPEGIDLRYAVTFGAFLPSVLVYFMLDRLYAGSGTKKMIAEICSTTGLQYKEDGFFDIAAAARHKILPDHNKSQVKGGFQGQYKSVSFSFQEVRLSEIRQDPVHESKKKEYLRFWGILVRVPLGRPAYGHTVVVPRVALKAWFMGRFSQYQLVVPTEPGRFGSIYDVVTSDKVEMKMIVGGAFKDQFIAAVRGFHAYWGEASFSGAEALFAFQRFRPLLRLPPLWKTVSDKAIRPVADDLRAIAGLIETLMRNAHAR